MYASVRVSDEKERKKERVKEKNFWLILKMEIVLTRSYIHSSRNRRGIRLMLEGTQL